MARRPTRYWSKRAPHDRDWDTLVVGSGMGGLTTAALLAKLGHRVLVLEQHYVPGGYTHAFRRQGYTWDVGVHIVGEASRKALPGRVMHALTDGRLQWADVGEVYDEFHFPGGRTFRFPSRPDAFHDMLADAFPHQADAVGDYLLATKRTADTLRPWFLGKALPGMAGRLARPLLARRAREELTTTTAERMEALIDDPQLRTVLTAQWGYHGSPPSRAAWGMQALITRHFQWGASYPVGGAASIAREFLRTVSEEGGWCRIVADVDQILIEDGRAVGVRMADGETIRAGRVVSAIGAWPTVTRLLPEASRGTAWTRRIAQHDPAPAHLSLYLGFKGDIEAAGATRQCQWFYDTWSHERSTWDVHPDRPVGRPPILFTSYPSLKDPEHDPGEDTRHTGEIITFVPWGVFQRWKDTRWRDRGDDYDAFKARMTEAMLEVLFEHRPGLRPLLDHAELSTPLSTDKFVRPYKGSIYGLAATPDRFTDDWLRADSPIDGLYLSGSDVAVCGVVGALMGGLLTAAAIEPVRAARFLKDVSAG